MPECPYFGEWFRSNKGLKQHVAKIHEISFAGEKMLNPLTLDPLGAMEKRAERRRRRKKIF